jgi:monoamine oxidase
VENKLFVRFEKPFWNTGDRWLSFVSEGRVNRYPSAFVAPYPHVHILIFFISGKYSLEMSEWTDAKLEKDIHDFLARYKKEGAIKIL